MGNTDCAGACRGRRETDREHRLITNRRPREGRHMWKLRFCVLAAIGLFALGTSAPAWASNGGGNSSHASNNSAQGNNTSAQGGDNNAGDVWVDNVGQPAGPGHEMDPHLACQDINLWGNGLSDSSGTYTISGWQPSGQQ